MRPPHPFNPLQAIVGHFRNTLGAGILVMLPIGITVLIFKFFFDLLDPLLLPVFRNWVPGPDPPGLGLATLLVLLYLAGLITAHVYGRRVVEIGHNIFGGIPVVKSVYSTARSAVELLATSGKDQPYSGVVLIDFPSRGLKSIGLVTANLGVQDGEEMLAVYVPASPIPTAGYLVVVAAKDVTPTQMTVDEAMKIIVSSGILAGDVFTLPPAQKAVSTPEEQVIGDKAI
jgi:uncharacterized membrane protein